MPRIWTAAFRDCCRIPDVDGDGVNDDVDNCPDVANADQADADADGIGDACEADSDGDGVIDDVDNCPTIANADQADADADGTGDVCDDDQSGQTDPNSTDGTTTRLPCGFGAPVTLSLSICGLLLAKSTGRRRRVHR